MRFGCNSGDEKDTRCKHTYCRLYEIDRRNLIVNRKDLDRGWFQVSWMHPLVKEYGVNGKLLLLGTGKMFDE